MYIVFFGVFLVQNTLPDTVIADHGHWKIQYKTNDGKQLRCIYFHESKNIVNMVNTKETVIQLIIQTKIVQRPGPKGYNTFY